MAPFIAPIITKAAEAAIASAAVAAGKHIAEHPSETLDALGDAAVKPLEVAADVLGWLADQIPD